MLLDLSIGSDEGLSEGALAVHIENDIAATNEGATDVNLRNGGPIREVLDALTELLVLQNVVVIVLGQVFSTQNVDNGTREAALGGLRSSLHVDDDRRGLDLLGNDILNRLRITSGIRANRLDGSVGERGSNTGSSGIF